MEELHLTYKTCVRDKPNKAAEVGMGMCQRQNQQPAIWEMGELHSTYKTCVKEGTKKASDLEIGVCQRQLYKTNKAAELEMKSALFVNFSTYHFKVSATKLTSPAKFKMKTHFLFQFTSNFRLVVNQLFLWL